jgi:hypothetical protein
MIRPQKTYHPYKIALTAVYGMIFLFGLAQFLLTNTLVTYGAQINTSDTKAQALMQENILLTQQVAVAKSLATLEARAVLAGFIKPTGILYLDDQPAVAVR